MKNFSLRSIALSAAVAVAATLSSCSDDDGPKYDNPDDYRTGAFFISATGESSEYILQAEDLESGELLIGDNIRELETSGYTWVFNSNPSVALGLIYSQGNPGIGLGFGFGENGNITKSGEFQITSRFTSYGFFEDYALTSVGGQAVLDSNGNAVLDDNGNERVDGVTFNIINLSNFSMTDKSITTLNITGNGELATVSGIVDMGNGTFLTGLICSQPRDENATGGSSSGAITYPDSVWLAAFDADLNLKRIYRDNRISYSSGRYRSQYYSQIGKASDGTIYVFSGSYDYNATATTRPCGALRINSGAEEFDQDYYFNIESLSGGYRFRKVWHVSGDYFLLEFYNHVGRLTDIDDPATQYAVVNMKDKSFKWLGGQFPSKDKIISSGLPTAYRGKVYFPVTIEGENPTIYVIDPATGEAAKGLSIRGAQTIRAVGRVLE